MHGTRDQSCGHRTRLRRAEPAVRPVRRPASQSFQAPRPRGLGEAEELRSADHGAGLDVDDVEQGSGHLGYYGFRNRADRSYEKMTTATVARCQGAAALGLPGAAGKRVILIGVPQTYPPRPINGLMVTDFLTPSIASNYTYRPTSRTNRLASRGPSLRVRRQRLPDPR